MSTAIGSGMWLVASPPAHCSPPAVWGSLKRHNYYQGARMRHARRTSSGSRKHQLVHCVKRLTAGVSVPLKRQQRTIATLLACFATLSVTIAVETARAQSDPPSDALVILSESVV